MCTAPTDSTSHSSPAVAQVFCLPDGYEVIERSLDDVRYVLNPTFSPCEVAGLDRDVAWARTLDGAEYMPGLVGLNDMRANDYANVIMQARDGTCSIQGSITPVSTHPSWVIRGLFATRSVQANQSRADRCQEGKGAPERTKRFCCR